MTRRRQAPPWHIEEDGQVSRGEAQIKRLVVVAIEDPALAVDHLQHPRLPFLLARRCDPTGLPIQGIKVNDGKIKHRAEAARHFRVDFPEPGGPTIAIRRIGSLRIMRFPQRS